METKENKGAQPPELRADPYIHQEFMDCFYSHKPDYRKPEFIRLLTALFGYDITKGLDSSVSDNKLWWTVADRFDNCENDKVVLATIGSVLQICETLAWQKLPGRTGVLDFNKFCEYVKRLYGCDLSGYSQSVGDFRYHVMAYLKGRSNQERIREKETPMGTAVNPGVMPN